MSGRGVLTSTIHILGRQPGRVLLVNLAIKMSTEPKLTPRILKAHGITYDPVVIQGPAVEHLPKHVNILREGLLDFDGFLIRDVIRDALEDTLHNYEDIPASAYRNTDNLRPWQRDMLREFVHMAKKISDEAPRLQQKQVPENGWENLFNRTVLKQRNDPLSNR